MRERKEAFLEEAAASTCVFEQFFRVLSWVRTLQADGYVPRVGCSLG